ncbi:MAG: hypothetical protein KDJ87_03880 [Rhizobiaceae bacterium]|nr:hypothetical protein [Rhizobiaceae bacterium]
MKFVYRVPVVGWLLREAVEGSAPIKLLFVVNCILLWLLAIFTFGYPAIILPALALTAGMFVILVMIMNG